jgi:small acid-soluble spore protein F (minor alpha/beta-type SASP)
MDMGRRKRGVMSEELKYELAKDLGFYDTVQKEGWSGIRAKDAGNMVKRAVQLAERALASQSQAQKPPMASAATATMTATRPANVTTATMSMSAPTVNTTAMQGTTTQQPVRSQYVTSVYQPKRYKP